MAGLFRARREVANELRAEDPKRNTQKRVAALLGMSQQLISCWWNVSSIKTGETPARPHAWVKIPPKERAEVAERVEVGESAAQVVADYGVTDRTVRSIASRALQQLRLCSAPCHSMLHLSE